MESWPVELVRIFGLIGSRGLMTDAEWVYFIVNVF